MTQRESRLAELLPFAWIRAGHLAVTGRMGATVTNFLEASPPAKVEFTDDEIERVRSLASNSNDYLTKEFGLPLAAYGVPDASLTGDAITSSDGAVRGLVGCPGAGVTRGQWLVTLPLRPAPSPWRLPPPCVGRR